MTISTVMRSTFPANKCYHLLERMRTSCPSVALAAAMPSPTRKKRASLEASDVIAADHQSAGRSTR